MDCNGVGQEGHGIQGIGGLSAGDAVSGASAANVEPRSPVPAKVERQRCSGFLKHEPHTCHDFRDGHGPGQHGVIVQVFRGNLIEIDGHVQRLLKAVAEVVQRKPVRFRENKIDAHRLHLGLVKRFQQAGYLISGPRPLAQFPQAFLIDIHDDDLGRRRGPMKGTQEFVIAQIIELHHHRRPEHGQEQQEKA